MRLRHQSDMVNIMMESFDKLVRITIAEHQVMEKRKELGELKGKLIELNAEIEELEKFNEKKSLQIANFWKDLSSEKTEFNQKYASLIDLMEPQPATNTPPSRTFFICDLSPDTTALTLQKHFTKWGRITDTQICHFQNMNLLCGYVTFAHDVRDFPTSHMIDNKITYMFANPGVNQFIVVAGKMENDAKFFSLTKKHFAEFGEIEFILKSDTILHKDSQIVFIKFKPPGPLSTTTRMFHDIGGKKLVAYEAF